MTSGHAKETKELGKYSNSRSEVLQQSGQAILSFLEHRLSQSRVCGGVLLMVLLLALLAQIHAAWTKAFWIDELLTIHVSSLRAPSAIWNALLVGADGMPLFYHWLTGQISLLPLDPHIAFRLLSILGYLMSMIGVYAFVGKRFGPILGLVAALLLALSPFKFYAIEARSYALLVGLLAIAAALWQRIEEGWWFTLAFAVCLGLAVASHHLAIVTLVCFGGAEFIAAFLYRRLRWRVWISLIFATMPFFQSLPLLLRYKIMFGAHFWAKPTLGSILSSYSQLEGLSPIYSVVFVVFVAIVAAAILLDRRSQTSKAQPIDGFSVPEIALSIGFLLFPVLLVILTMTQHSGYTERYAWPLILGFVFAFVFVFRRLDANSHSTWLLCALMIVFVLENCKLLSATQSARQFAQAAFAERLEGLKVASARYRLEENTPVVIADSHEYMPAVYYSDLSLSNRCYFLADPQAALRFTGVDSGDRTMLALSRAIPVQARVEDASVFIAKHKSFIIWASNQLNCWLPKFLIERGVRLELIQETALFGPGQANDERGQVYLAESEKSTGSTGTQLGVGATSP
jgi:hypothetical protein